MNTQELKRFEEIRSRVKREEEEKEEKKQSVKSLKGKQQDYDYPYDIFTVGDKAHVCHYSDVTPVTVVGVKRNGTEVTVRQDSYELAEGEKPNVIAGGFAGHCQNQRDLRYDITEDEDGGRSTYTLRKWRGRYCWTLKGTAPNGYQQIGIGWVAFYDYNF